MHVIKNKKIYFIISGFLVLASIVSLILWGLRLGIDFNGGSILEVGFDTERPALVVIEEEVGTLDIGAFSVRPTGENGYIIKSRVLSEAEKNGVLEALSVNEQVVHEERFNTVGPTIGQELRSKALFAIIVVVLAIILFIAYVFRKVSKPVSSWKYGLVAIGALIHDILIPIGVFSVLGYVVGIEIDILFVMALLAILGFSVNDTIVVFDRIRENLRLNQEDNKHEDFDEVVGRSLEQTFARSINTSLTTLLVLLALYFIGGASTQMFALALIIGVISGTYSSIFLASPLLVWIEGRQKNK